MKTRIGGKWLLLGLLISQAVLTAQVIDPKVRDEAARSQRLQVLITLRHQPQRAIMERVAEIARPRIEAAHTNWRILSTTAPARNQALLNARAQLDTLLVEMRTEAGRQIEVEIAPHQDLVEARLLALGARDIMRYRAITMLAANIPSAALPALETDPEIAHVGLPDTLRSLGQVNLDTIYAPVFWDNSKYTGVGESIAVLDSGIDKNHEYFAAIKGNIDDTRIYLTNKNNSTSPCYAGDAAHGIPGDRGADDKVGHGTKMAGIIAGRSADSTVTGIAPGLGTGASGKLYSLKVACEQSQNAGTGFSNDADIRLALNDALAGDRPLPVQIFNFSSGALTYTWDDHHQNRIGQVDDTDLAKDFDAIIDNDSSHHISIVVAAGNSGTDGANTVESPAIGYNVIAVANMDPNGSVDRSKATIDPSSSRGPTLSGRKKPDLAAPGMAIPTPTANTTNGYGTSNGTSAAAPHIAGALTLLHQFGVTSALGAKALLINSAEQKKDQGNYVGWEADVGWGYTDLEELRAEAHLAPDATPGSLPCLDDSGGTTTKGGCFVGTVGSDGYRLFQGKVTSEFKATLVWNRHLVTGATITSLLQNLDLIVYVKQGDGYVQVSSDPSTIDNVKQVSATAAGDYMIKVKAHGTFDAAHAVESFALAVSSPFEGVVEPALALTVTCPPPDGVQPNTQFTLTCSVTNPSEMPAENLKANLSFPQMALGVPPQFVNQDLGLVPGKGSAPLSFSAMAPLALPEGSGHYDVAVFNKDAAGNTIGGSVTSGDLWANDCWKAIQLIPASLTVNTNFTHGTFQVDVPAGCVWRVSMYPPGPSPAFGPLNPAVVTGPGKVDFGEAGPPPAKSGSIPIWAGVNMRAASFVLIVDPNAPATFTASGYVRTPQGDSIPGVTVSFALAGGGAPAAVQTDANGLWSQSGFSYDKSYTATAALSGYTITPAALTIAGASSGYNFKGTPPYALSGLITNSVGSAISGVTLTFNRTAGGGSSPAAVQTDPAGKWSQTGFDAAASFSVTPAKTGCTFSPTSLTASGAKSNVNFSGTCPFTASGKITLKSGGALAGVTLVFTAASGTPPASVVSDTSGNWSQSAFETGVAYTVTPSLAGYTFALPSLPFSSASATLNFVADGPYAASGKVTDKAGTAVGGVTITFTRSSGSGAAPAAVTTGPNGQWSQTGFDSGVQFVATPSMGDATFAPPSSTLTGATATANFVATTHFAVSGKVTLKSGGVLAGVTLTFAVVSGTGPVPIAVVSATDGTWSQTGFESGTSYKVTPSLAGYAFKPPGPGFSAATSTLNFTAVHSFTVSGKVVDDSGKALGGVAMRFTRLTGTGPLPANVQTGPAGAWTQTGFEDGTTYRVTPVLAGYEFNPSERDFAKEDAALDFTGVKGYGVSGQVIGINGNGVADVTITFMKNAGNGKLPLAVVTDSKGHWQQIGFEQGTNYRASAGGTYTPPFKSFNQPDVNIVFRAK